MAFIINYACYFSEIYRGGIESIPKGSVGSKIAAWIIPVLIIALIVLGFFMGNAKVGKDMILDWVIWNAALSGAGALIAGGNPLAILTAMVASPITSLNPLIGVGMFSGIVQAVMNKPKVSDMETLQGDVSSLKGWYKNRVLRVFLVFILSSLGSVAGTFIGIPTIVSELTPHLKAWFEALKK